MARCFASRLPETVACPPVLDLRVLGMGGRAGDLWRSTGLDPGNFQVFRYLRLWVKRDRESSTLAMGSRSGAETRAWELRTFCLSCSWMPLGWEGVLMWARWGLAGAWDSPRALGLTSVLGLSRVSSRETSSLWADPRTVHWVSHSRQMALHLASVV